MKRLKLQRKGLGCLDYIIAAFSICLAILNILNQRHLEINIIAGSYLTIPFLVVGILALTINLKTCLSISFLIAALYTSLDPSNGSDYSGAMFFFFAFHLYRKTWYGIFIYSLTVLSISIRTTFFGMTIFQSFMLLLAFTASYLAYYLIIYKTIPKPFKSRIKELSDNENELLTLIGSGLKQKETYDITGNSPTKTAYLIRQIKKKTGYKTLEHLFNESDNTYNSKNISKK